MRSIGVASGCAAAVAIGVVAGGAAAARAQDEAGAAAPSSYEVQQGDVAAPAAIASDDSSSAQIGTDDSANDGPVRMARVSLVEGSVTWRPDDQTDWAPATINLPLRQGAQFWVTGNSRVEIQFDDGSILRLGTGAVVTLQTLYSDANGEFTEIRLNEGLMSLRLKHPNSIFQVDATNLSARAAGPAKLRVGVDNDTEIAVRQGEVSVEGDQGRTRLVAGDYLDVADADAPLQVSALPPADDWDAFNDDRDRVLDNPAHYAGYCPSSVALVAGDLADYGTWQDEPQYGEVWFPHVSDPGWCPYHYGHWVWCEPFGWTWVSSEPWGWAPYHYGTWVHVAHGWGWCPGPAVQYWSPAVVHFVSCGNSVAWVPLAPHEVRYPSTLAIAYRHGNWATSFSVGATAVYYQSGPTWFAPRPWHNTYVNHVTHITNITNVTNVTNITNVYYGGAAGANHYHYVPVNAHCGGVTQIAAGEFGRHGHHEFVAPSDGPGLFLHGRPLQVVDARPGANFVAGPATIRPTAGAWSPTDHFVAGAGAGPRNLLQRPVYRTPVPVTVERNSLRSGAFVHPGARGPFSDEGIRRTPSPQQRPFREGADNVRLPGAGNPGGAYRSGGSFSSHNDAGRDGGDRTGIYRPGATRPGGYYRPEPGRESAAEAAARARASLGDTGRRDPGRTEYGEAPRRFGDGNPGATWRTDGGTMGRPRTDTPAAGYPRIGAPAEGNPRGGDAYGSAGRPRFGGEVRGGGTWQPRYDSNRRQPGATSPGRNEDGPRVFRPSGGGEYPHGGGAAVRNEAPRGGGTRDGGGERSHNDHPSGGSHDSGSHDSGSHNSGSHNNDSHDSGSHDHGHR